MRESGGRVGDVARALGGILVTPPVHPIDIRRTDDYRFERSAGDGGQKHKLISCL